MKVATQLNDHELGLTSLVTPIIVQFKHHDTVARSTSSGLLMGMSQEGDCRTRLVGAGTSSALRSNQLLIELSMQSHNILTRS